MDFVQVIERSVLTYRVKTRDHLETEVWIDAYTGAVRGRHSEGYTDCFPLPKKH